MKIKQIVREFKERTPGWFDKHFEGHYAQISTVMTLKVKSAILDAARFIYGRGQIPYEIQGLTKKIPLTPQGVSDAKFVFGYEDSGEWVKGILYTDPALMEIVRKYPKVWDIAKEALALPKSTGSHASAYILSGDPLEGWIPTSVREGFICTQYEAKAVEAVGGVKYDFLLVKNLNVIQDAVALIQSRSSVSVPDGAKTKLGNSPKCNLVPINGTFYDIWALPEDPLVFEDITFGRVETVSQLDTSGVKRWLKYFEEPRADGSYIIDSISKMAIFTALDRPGPLDMELESPDGGIHNGLVEYVRRCLGKGDSPTVLPVFRELFPQTEGLVVFQESLQYAYQYLTGSDGAEADEFRSFVGKKNKEKIMAAYPSFMERASVKLGSKELAQQVWDGINTFANYSFCMSHAYVYSLVSYACAYLKHHFPLEWWCSVLKSANKEKIASNYWKFIESFVQLPDISSTQKDFNVTNGKICFPLQFLHGVGDGAQSQLFRYAPYKDLKDFCDKIQYHKDLYGTPETIKEVNKKGVEVVKIKKNPGHSAINAGTAYTMILAGAMDSFFPEDYTLVEKLGEFERVYAESQNKKVKPVNPAYLTLTAYQEFVLKKQILPVWGKNLMDVMVDCKHEMVSTTYGTPKFRVGNQWVDMYSLEDYKDLEGQRDVWIPKGGLTVALAGMVIETRNFPYSKDGKQCEACEVNLELQGEIFKFVQWPDRNTGVLDRRFGSKLEKSLVVLILSKWASDRPFAIKDMVIIEPAFELKLKEK